VLVPQEAHRDTLRHNCVFESWAICWSCNAFWCVWDAKRRRTIFHAWMGPVRVLEEAHRMRYAKLVFLHPVRFGGNVVHSGVYGVRNINALFLILRWARCQSHKKHARTRYAELVFLHSVRSRGHVARCSASGARNVNALFFTLGWTRCRIHKRRSGTHYATCVFASGVIFRSHSVFWCIRGVKHRRTIFNARVDPCGSHMKRARTRYAELVFLHPMRSGGHVVRSEA
jgi:hypothetical protein